jgi:hypothetical protein
MVLRALHAGEPQVVMAGLDPAIHVCGAFNSAVRGLRLAIERRWIARHTQVGFSRLAQLKSRISGKPEIRWAMTTYFSSATVFYLLT